MNVDVVHDVGVPQGLHSDLMEFTAHAVNAVFAVKTCLLHVLLENLPDAVLTVAG